MTQCCTIYCKTKNLKEIARLIHQQFPGCSSDDLADEWDSIVVHGREGNLRFTSKWFHQGGDDFCRLLLSTIAFVEGIPNVDPVMKTYLTSHVESCELVLGVVATPSLDADKRYHAVVFLIAKELGGIVFNGEEMLDANGQRLVGTD